jgi:hypothetical protein
VQVKSVNCYRKSVCDGDEQRGAPRVQFNGGSIDPQTVRGRRC